MNMVIENNGNVISIISFVFLLYFIFIRFFTKTLPFEIVGWELYLRDRFIRIFVENCTVIADVSGIETFAEHFFAFIQGIKFVE
jgi:hypothetical protein